MMSAPLDLQVTRGGAGTSAAMANKYDEAAGKTAATTGKAQANESAPTVTLKLEAAMRAICTIETTAGEQIGAGGLVQSHTGAKLVITNRHVSEQFHMEGLDPRRRVWASFVNPAGGPALRYELRLLLVDKTLGDWSDVAVFRILGPERLSQPDQPEARPLKFAHHIRGDTECWILADASAVATAHDISTTTFYTARRYSAESASSSASNANNGSSLQSDGYSSIFGSTSQIPADDATNANPTPSSEDAAQQQNSPQSDSQSEQPEAPLVVDQASRFSHGTVIEAYKKKHVLFHNVRTSSSSSGSPILNSAAEVVGLHFCASSRALETSNTNDQPDQQQQQQHHMQQLRRGSSITCTGNSTDSRQCTAHRLCLRTATNDLVLLRGPDTLIDGLPDARFDPAVIALSSVERHNVQWVNLVDLPVDAALLNSSRVEWISGSSLLFKRFKPNNIFHVLHDDLLPIFATLALKFDTWSDARQQSSIRPVAMEGWAPGEFAPLYNLFSDKPMLYRRMLSEDTDFVCFERAWLGLSKATTWYDYGFHEPQGPIPNKVVDGAVVRRFAQTVAAKLGIEGPEQERADSTRGKQIVVFSRRRNRLITNEQQLIFALAHTFGCSVVAVSMETHTFAEQVRELRQAWLAVGMHGSILGMAMFLPPGATLLELFPWAVPAENYTPYKTMASLPGMQLKYLVWTNTHRDRTTAHPTRISELGGIAHLSQEEQEQIMQTETVPPHKCCSDPYWLYRIYQDTEVDVKEIIALIKGSQDRAPEAQASPFKLYPGQVTDVACRLIPHGHGGHAAAVSWSAPWNAEGVAVTAYEAWHQESLKHWPVQGLVLEVDATELGDSATHTFWVRAISASGGLGPFSAGALCAVS
eukprot:m.190023 g.190023  ORF g.190023 m.190023 type:complete len:871 (-) comp17557_c0_seq4:1593-4205(-)